MTKERILQFVAVAFNTVTSKELCKKLVMDFLKEELPDGSRMIGVDMNKLDETLRLRMRLNPRSEVINMTDTVHQERNGKYLLIKFPDDADPEFALKIKKAADALIKKPDPGHQNGAAGPEKGMHPDDELSFSEAWKFMKMGNRIKRKAWTGSKYIQMGLGDKPHFFEASKGEAIAGIFPEDAAAIDWIICN